MNGGRFGEDVGTKGLFWGVCFTDNGERGRSLLCAREALAKPPGAAGSLLNAVYLSCVQEREKKIFDASKIFRVSGGA